MEKRTNTFLKKGENKMTTKEYQAMKYKAQKARAEKIHKDISKGLYKDDISYD